MRTNDTSCALVNRRILVVAEDLKPGGATLVLGRTLDYLQSSGASVICVTAGCSADTVTEWDVVLDKDATKGGWGMRGRAMEIPRAWRLLKRFQPDLVVVNVTSPGFMFAFMFFNVPVLYHLHPPIEDKSKFVRHLIYPRMRKKSKRIIVVSNWHCENVRKQWRIPESVITILPNYPERAVAMGAQRDIVLTAARFSPDKNPAFWFEVGKRLQPLLDKLDLQMVWCAPSISEAERLSLGPLPSCLQLVEICKQTELNDYFSRSVVYYQPSLLEPQGIAVLEAMQNGIPCVVNAETGMTDCMRSGETGLVVQQNDVQAHVEALTMLLKHDKLREDLATRAYNLIKAKYQKERWEESYCAVLHSVL